MTFLPFAIPNIHFFVPLPRKNNRGALILRAEIKPSDLIRVMPA